MLTQIIRQLALAAPVAMLGVPAHAYTILAPNAVVAGQPIVDWTASWWTWALQAPLSANPLLDTTGAFANVNNNGAVHFIAGAGDTEVRSFNVPAGKPVLFPIVNTVTIDSIPPDPPGTPLADRKAANDAYISAFLGAINTGSMFTMIDGTPIHNLTAYLQQTDYFTTGPSQPDSLLDAIGVPAGTEGFPAKSTGYWLMVDGLTPGAHTIHFGGSWNTFTPPPNCCSNGETLGAVVDVTANIYVVPEPGSAVLLMTGLAAAGGLFRLRRKS